VNAKQNAIAAEYGEPFWSVVRGYADDGHSVYGTATLLEYSPPAFRRLVLRHGVSDWFARGQSSALARSAQADRRGRCTDAQRAGAAMASAANPNYRWIDYQGHTDTLAGHARRLGLSPRTVYKRYKRRPDDQAYVFADGRHVVVPHGSGWQQWRIRLLKPDERSFTTGRVCV